MFLSPHVCQPDGIGLGFRVGPGDGLDLHADSLHKRLQKQHGYITKYHKYRVIFFNWVSLEFAKCWPVMLQFLKQLD